MTSGRRVRLRPPHEDHDHPDQANYDPLTAGGAALRALLTPAPQHVGALQRTRDAWAARNIPKDSQ